MAKKRRFFDDDLLGDFDREFERTRSEMEELIEGMMDRVPEPDIEKLSKEGKSGYL